LETLVLEQQAAALEGSQLIFQNYILYL